MFYFETLSKTLMELGRVSTVARRISVFPEPVLFRLPYIYRDWDFVKA